MKYTFSVFVLLAFFALQSCKKDPIPPNIFVIPGGIHIQTTAGSLIEFDIDANQGDNNLSKIIITQKPTGGITTTLLDTTLSGSNADFFFVYEVPSGWEDILISFTVRDTEGLDGATARRLFITGNTPLVESTGHLMYSPFALSSPNAFDLETNSPLVLNTLSDSSMVHLTEMDMEDNDELSLSLTSFSGNKFVRNNSFNYPEATSSSAQNSYESSTALQLIPNLAVDDIIITEYDTVNNLFAVMKITGIQDLSGSDSDRYTFNIKK